MQGGHGGFWVPGNGRQGASLRGRLGVGWAWGESWLTFSDGETESL